MAATRDFPSVQSLTEFLVLEAGATESDDFIQELLAKAKAKILAGQGGSIADLTSTSLNGKNFAREVQMTYSQVALAARRALNEYAGHGRATGITVPNFGA